MNAIGEGKYQLPVAHKPLNRFQWNFSKGMREVKLCTNKILQFLTGGAG